jgi:hypothetical protein
MSLFSPTALYFQAPLATGPVATIRTDTYSASVQLAMPGALFSSLGMTQYYNDISSQVRGNGSNIITNATGSSADLNAATGVVKFASDGYGTSIFQQNGGTPGNVLDTGSPQLAFGSGNWVVEAWFYMTSRMTKPPFWKVAIQELSNYNIDCDWGNAASGTTNARMRIVLDTSTTGQTQHLSSDFAYNLNQWYHVAWVRSGTALYSYFDGTRRINSTTSGTIDTSANQWKRLLTGGNAAADGTPGYVQDFRITLGSDRGYTGATITPPPSIVINT